MHAADETSDTSYEIAEPMADILHICSVSHQIKAILVLDTQHEREGTKRPSTTLIGRQGTVAARATLRPLPVPFDHFDHGLAIR